MSNQPNDTNVLDVDHEEVAASPDAGKPTPALLTTDQIVQNEVAKYDTNKAAIEDLKKKFGSLTITGPDDKAGYEAVKKAWGLVRSTRTGVEKKGVELRGAFNKITKAIKTYEDELLEALEPLEAELQQKWKKVDEDREAAKRKQEQEEQERLLTRINKLIAAGCQLVDGFYSLGDTITVDVATLRSLPDDKFTYLVEAAERKKAELDELERQRLENEEKDRLKLEAEQKKLKEDQEKLEQQKRELEEQQQQFAKMKRELRTGKVLALGMQLNGGTFVYDNGFTTVTHSVESLMELDDYGFDEHLKILSGYVNEAKQKWEQHQKELEREREELAAKELYISRAMDTAGLKYNLAMKRYEFSNPQGRVEIFLESELLPMSVDDITCKALELADRVLDLQRKQKEHVEKEQERERLEAEALKSDEQKLRDYFTKLNAVPVPQLTTLRFIGAVGKITSYLIQLTNQYLPEHEQN